MAIDKTKGIAYTPPPKYWSKRQQYIPIPENCSLEERQEIEKQNQKIRFNNSICCDKKAYFFRYIYPVKGQEWDEFAKFQKDFVKFSGCKDLEALYLLKERTPKQQRALMEVNRTAPLFRTRCAMQYLVDDFSSRAIYKRPYKNKKSIRHKPLSLYTLRYYKNVSRGAGKMSVRRMFSFNLDISKGELFTNNLFVTPFMLMEYEVTAPRMRAAEELYKKYNASYQKVKASLDEVYENEHGEDYKRMKSIMFNSLFDSFTQEAHLVSDNVQEALDAFYYVYLKTQNESYGMLLWRGFGDEIVERVKKQAKYNYLLVKDENGVDYLGEKFAVMRINKESGEVDEAV